MAAIPRLNAADWPAPGPRAVFATAMGILAIQVGALAAMGHSMFCACGYIEIWHSAPAGPGTSQHLFDWYSVTHLIHGFLLYLLLRTMVPAASLGMLLAISLGAEAIWEIVENTPFVIERYRETALATGYFGDSIVNSLTDMLAMVVGFGLARRMPVTASIAVVIAVEVAMAAIIRDNLTLNIIQLVYPIEVISQWQSGA